MEAETEPEWNVVFTLHYHAAFGDTVGIIGGDQYLGGWAVEAGRKLTWSEGDIWSVRVSLRPSAFVVYHLLEFKYIVFKSDGSVQWEQTPNRIVHLGASSFKTEGGAQVATLRNEWEEKSPVSSALQMLFVLSPKLKRIDRVELSPAMQHKLQDAINKQGEFIRHLRDTDPRKDAPIASRPELFRHIRTHLDLKFRDPEYCKQWGDKVVKIRWKVIHTDNSTVQLQFPFPYHTSVTAEEVVRAIYHTTHAKYPDIGHITKLEAIERNEEGQKQSREVVSEYEQWVLPLVFPGPVFVSSFVFQFRVHWTGSAAAPAKQYWKDAT